MDNLSAEIRQKADLIWAIADKLTGVYKPHEYGEVILPLTVIRRFDCVLADTKDAVLDVYEREKGKPEAILSILLRKAAGRDFYNTSKFNFERLASDADNIKSNLTSYLESFSPNVREIIAKFKFNAHIETMAEKGILSVSNPRITDWSLP